jgi:hypothetical protein
MFKLIFRKQISNKLVEAANFKRVRNSSLVTAFLRREWPGLSVLPKLWDRDNSYR